MNSKTFREYLYEQAFSKDVMISKFTNNSDNIFNHILKVLVYNDTLNSKKHLREMAGIVRSLQNKTIKSKIALRIYTISSTETSRKIEILVSISQI